MARRILDALAASFRRAEARPAHRSGAWALRGKVEQQHVGLVFALSVQPQWAGFVLEPQCIAGMQGTTIEGRRQGAETRAMERTACPTSKRRRNPEL